MKLKVFSVLWLCVISFCQCQQNKIETPCKTNQVDFNFQKSLQESAFDNDITLSREFSFSGEQSVKFNVSPGSYVANGNRAELTYDGGALAGDEKWYSWKIFIPTDYPDVPMRDQDFEPNWQLMGQWHQQPVLADGETWEDFTVKGESPSVGINYYFLAADDPDYQNLKKDDKMLAVPGYDPAWNHLSVFILTYGTPPVPVAITRIEKGQWINVLVNIYWSEREDGYISTGSIGRKSPTEKPMVLTCGTEPRITSNLACTKILTFPIQMSYIMMI